MKVFAYGSNMNINRLKRRVPSAKKISNAFIKGYTLKCNKVSEDGSSKATIVESGNPDDTVWGVIFEISDTEKGVLDKREGIGKGYNETSLTFTDTDNNTQEAQIYVADNDATDDELQPYDWYKHYIVTGAEENQLPKDYITQLQTIEFTVDPDEDRRRRRYAILNTKS